MINPDWTRWIVASFHRHLQTLEGDVFIHGIQDVGQELTTDKRIEAKVNSPIFVLTSSDSYEVSVEVAVILTSADTDKPLQHYTDAGVIQNKLTQCVLVSQIGDEMDTLADFANAAPDGDLLSNTERSAPQIQQTLIVGRYTLFIEDGTGVL